MTSKNNSLIWKFEKMEKLEIEHIDKHRYDLTQNTICNESLLSILRANDILSKEDVQELVMYC